MSRYSNINAIKRWDGRQVFQSVRYPQIVPQETDVQIVTNETTHLDTLANKYYGDATLYWVIILANSGIGNGRLSVPAGLTLRIPTNISYILNQFKVLNQ